jgi:hypothetical protein
MLSSFPSIACLGYFPGLACPDLSADCCPNTSTYKSQRYTSRLKYAAHYYKLYIHTLSLLELCLAFTHTFTRLLFHAAGLKGPAGPTFFCWAQCVCTYISHIAEHFAVMSLRSTRFAWQWIGVVLGLLGSCQNFSIFLLGKQYTV